MSDTNLHLVRNSVDQDSRVLKVAHTLVDTGWFERTEVYGLSERTSSLEEARPEGFHIWRPRLRTRQLPKDLASQTVKYLEWYCRAIKRYRRAPLAVIHCHDLAPLPIAARLKAITGAKLIYDAHELETEVKGSRGVRKLLARETETRLLRFVDAMITVSPSIKSWYEARFPDVSVGLVRNIPELPEIGSAAPLRERYAVPSDALLFLYLGGLTSDRGIENALAAFREQGVKHHLLFMGTGPLGTAVLEAARSCPRIHHLDPVPPGEVINYATGADVGVCLYEDTCLNHRYCLPNKLFECLVAGIPVLASDLVDQSAIVADHQGGWIVSNDSGRIADTLRKLTVDEQRACRAGLANRTRGLRWANEAQVLRDVYRGVGVGAN